jgi:hypothetical protein
VLLVIIEVAGKHANNSGVYSVPEGRVLRYSGSYASPAHPHSAKDWMKGTGQGSVSAEKSQAFGDIGAG